MRAPDPGAMAKDNPASMDTGWFADVPADHRDFDAEAAVEAQVDAEDLAIVLELDDSLSPATLAEIEKKAHKKGAKDPGRASSSAAGKPGDPGAGSARKTDANGNPLSKRELRQETKGLDRQAQSAIQQGSYSDAIELLKQSIQTDPTQRDANGQLAKLKHTMSLTQDEAKVYADWSANRPEDPSPHYRQAALYEVMGLDAQALGELQQFQALSSANPGALGMAASMFRRLDMSQQEGATLQEWVGAAPDSLDAHRALAQYLTRTGDRPAAAAEYQAIADITPLSADAHRDLASAYQRMRQFDLAQAELSTALNLQPQNLSLQLQLAQVYRQSGDPTSALATYTNIVGAAPYTQEARQAQRAITQIQRQMQTPVKPKSKSARAGPESIMR